MSFDSFFKGFSKGVQAVNTETEKRMREAEKACEQKYDYAQRKAAHLDNDDLLDAYRSTSDNSMKRAYRDELEKRRS